MIVAKNILKNQGGKAKSKWWNERLGSARKHLEKESLTQREHFLPTRVPSELRMGELAAVRKQWGTAGTIADMKQVAATVALTSYAARDLEGLDRTDAGMVLSCCATCSGSIGH